MKQDMPQAAKRTEPEILHPEVMEALVEWRRKRAMKAHMPAYCIMQQKAIIAIANQLPQTKEALADIPIVGKVRAEKYGEEILATIYDILQRED